MKYAIITLAVGDKYFTPVLEHYQKVCKRFSGDFIITTDKIASNIDNIRINTIKLDKYYGEQGHMPFYFNLKSLAFKSALDQDYDFVLYIDSDWKILDGLTNEVLENAFIKMNELGLDLLFERPAKIKGGKQNPKESFFKNKLDAYHVLEHNKWDDAHVMNEQIFLVKNSWKLRYFTNRWEQFLWFSIYNNIWNYAEGFEAGISALEADMVWNYNLFRSVLPNCFEFYDIVNNKHTRF